MRKKVEDFILGALFGLLLAFGVLLLFVVVVALWLGMPPV